MNAEQFSDLVATMLRQQPAGTVACFGDFAMASLSDEDVVYWIVAGEGSFVIGERFNLSEEWDRYKAQLVAWMTDPQYGDGVKVASDRMSPEVRS